MSRRRAAAPARYAEPIGRERQLAGVVHLNPAVETVLDPKLGCVLEWSEAPRPRRGLKRLFPEFRLRRRLRLDPMGRETIERIDGHSTVDAIARQLAALHGSDPDAMRDSLLAFLAALMKKNIVVVTDP